MLCAGGHARFDVLVIDDDKAIRRTIRICLVAAGCRVDEAPSATGDARGAREETLRPGAARRAARRRRRNRALAAADRRRRADGRDCDDRVRVIESAVEVMRRGATDYLAKPFTPDRLRGLVGSIAARRAIDRRVDAGRTRRSGAMPEIHLHTEAPMMLQTLDLAGRAPSAIIRSWLSGSRIRQDAPRAPDARFERAQRGPVRDSGRCRGCRYRALSPARQDAAAGGTLFVDGASDFLRRNRRRSPTSRRRGCASSPRRPRSWGFERFLLLHVPSLRERREDILPLARRALGFFAQGTPIPKAEPTLEAETPWPPTAGQGTCASSVAPWSVRSICAPGCVSGWRRCPTR